MPREQTTFDVHQCWLQAQKEAQYYRKVAEETGKKALRRIEQLEELIARNKESEQELARLLEKVKESNQDLSDFVYIVSHDLREPLRKITLFGSILNESIADGLSEDDAQSLAIMIDGTQRMQEMIDALLLYSRVTTKAAPFVSVDLYEIIKQLHSFELAVLLEEKNVIMDISDTLPTVLADPVQIRQLLQNLIANGTKYQATGSQPRIAIRAIPIDSNMARIEVVDNGIGIESVHQKNIFTMFKRVHTNNEYEGTGVGLAVCKKIVKRHGGQIGVDSELGEGATFWFTLPISSSETVGCK